MKRVIAFLVSILIIITYLPINVSAADTVDKDSIGNTYYVDSANGDDANTGTSVGKPWKTLDKVNSVVFQPGDKLLFKAGCSWTGQLRPHGSGAEGKPIVIDMYGIGEKPIFDGAGIVDKEKTENDNVSTTFMLKNQQYIEVNNLHLTNVSEKVNFRRAVFVTAENIGACNHIYLKNLAIDNIRSYSGCAGYRTGGIVCVVDSWEKPTIPTYFKDLKIENCSMTDIDQSGIFIRNNSWISRGAWGGPAAWVPSIGVVIRNNSFSKIGGDGIVICECKDALVEHNVASECHKTSTGANAGFWAINSDNTIFQYNEVYLTRTTIDGQAFDCDANCNGTTFQYNYSHDNEGGFMLICNFFQMDSAYNEDNTIRYNISQNDCNSILEFSTGKNFNTKVYNNTIYINKGMSTRIINHGAYANVDNNIIYNLGDGGYIYDADTCYFDNNCYFGNKTAGEPQEPHGVYADPKLINAGSGKIGINTLAGYRLKANSPCINAGKVIDNNGGKDFFGQPAPYPGTLPDIGASEYQGKGKSPVGLNNEFDSTLMAKGWSFVREDKANWSLKNRPGYLSITTQPGDLSGSKNSLKNILTQPAKDSNFVVSTKLDFKPGENGQNAGLIIYGDDDNYYTLTRDNLSGAAFIARNESKGTSKTLGRKTDVITSATSYLKIEKNGDIYTSYYSADGSTWTQLAQTSGINIANPKIGVIAGTTKTQTKSINADFDYIHYGIYDPNPSPIIDNFDSSYLDGRWSIVKENSSDWNLTDRPGYLRIKAGPGTLEGIWNNNIRNIFLQNSPTEDFSIETDMEFKPIQNGQKAGLIVYQDADNYLSLTRQRTADSISSSYVVTQEINGVTTKVGFNDDVSSKQEVLLKIEKVGSTYNAYVRTDSSTWFLIAKSTNNSLTKPMVGVFTTRTSNDVSNINADFKSFTYQPLVKTVEAK